MKRPPLPKIIAAIGMAVALIPLQQAAAQDEAIQPTVPKKGTGGPEAVELTPELTQAKPAERPGAAVRTDLTIAEIVAGAEEFTTLAGALRATGLADELKEEGPFTLLAPNNAAFAALPPGVLTTLTRPENLDVLKKILRFHIIPAKLKAEDLVPANYATSGGEKLTITGRAKGEMAVQGVGFGTTDVLAENGVVHVVKAVLVPPNVKIADYLPAKTAPAPE